MVYITTYFLSQNHTKFRIAITDTIFDPNGGFLRPKLGKNGLAGIKTRKNGNISIRVGIRTDSNGHKSNLCEASRRARA